MGTTQRPPTNQPPNQPPRAAPTSGPKQQLDGLLPPRLQVAQRQLRPAQLVVGREVGIVVQDDSQLLLLCRSRVHMHVVVLLAWQCEAAPCLGQAARA